MYYVNVCDMFFETKFFKSYERSEYSDIGLADFFFRKSHKTFFSNSVHFFC